MRRAWRSARRRWPGGGARQAIAFCALPDERVHDAARSLQLELERRYGANPGLDAPPHITLKLGFEVGGPEPFERYLDELAATTEPFEVAVGDLGFFDEGIVFLEVERHPRLEALRRRILADLAARFGIEPYPLEAGDAFRFHVTVARDLGPAALADARRSLQVSRPALRFRLERLALLRSAGEGWVTGRTATLAGPGPSPRNVG
jgi:2'-5' RNA ligase